MKTILKARLKFLTALLLASAVTYHVLGGHPTWPPAKHSAGYRQANMIFLRFQDALAAERWPEALALCSARVQAKAAEWPSSGAFFKDTVPIDLLLAHSFGCWSCSENFYGLLVPLTEPDSQPFVQWHWAISSSNNKWVVDYPPVKLEEFIARQKATAEERSNNVRLIRLGLGPKLKGLKTHLVPITTEFTVGQPMLFRVELANQGPDAVEYEASWVDGWSLSVLDAQAQALPPNPPPFAQIQFQKKKVGAGGSVVLSGRIDVNSNHSFTRPGRYDVRFNGSGLQIGQSVPHWEPGPFGENNARVSAPSGFLALTNQLPSEPIQIEVGAERKP